MARLLFFGKLSDLAGGRMREFDLPDTAATVKSLVAAIVESDSILGAALADKSVRFIVNEVIVLADHELTNDDEIAFLPPVSGG